MIFVTGANGLIGSFIVRRLIEEKFPIRCLKRQNSDLKLAKDFVDKVEWVDGDLNDVLFLEKSLKGISSVVHCAGMISFASSKYEEMLKVNTEGTRNMVNASLEAGVRRFCHVSSVAALGRKKNVSLIDESSIWEESTYNSGYGKTKYLAELEAWRGFEEGLKGFIINPSIVFGPGDWNKGSTKIFKYVWDENLFYPQGKVNFVDVRDISNIVCQLLQSEITKERFILNGGSIDYQYLLNKIAENFNKRKPKFKTNALLSYTAVCIEGLKGLLTKKEPLLTRETVKMSSNVFNYDNSKIKHSLNYNFRTIDDTISWVTKEILKSKVI